MADAAEAKDEDCSGKSASGTFNRKVFRSIASPKGQLHPAFQEPIGGTWATKNIQASHMLGAEGSKQNNVQLHTEPRAMKPGQAVRQWFAFCGRADWQPTQPHGPHFDSQGDAIPSNRPQPIGRHGDCIKELTSTSKTLGGSF